MSYMELYFAIKIWAGVTTVAVLLGYFILIMFIGKR